MTGCGREGRHRPVVGGRDHVGDQVGVAEGDGDQAGGVVGGPELGEAGRASASRAIFFREAERSAAAGEVARLLELVGLPPDADEGRVKADLKNGVLTVTVPKAKAEEKKEEVKAEEKKEEKPKEEEKVTDNGKREYAIEEEKKEE